jgi:hypothetical protein
VALFQEFVNMPVNGRPSLFRIDSIHLIATSLSHAWSINIKSMGMGEDMRQKRNRQRDDFEEKRRIKHDEPSPLR